MQKNSLHIAHRPSDKPFPRRTACAFVHLNAYAFACLYAEQANKKIYKAERDQVAYTVLKCIVILRIQSAPVTVGAYATVYF